MIKNTIINRGIIKKIALALNELNEDVIYVGGAVVSLYINDPAADDVRPTKDIDISLSVATYAELETVREKLVTKGFSQTSEDHVVCRFRYDDVKVDVMNTKSIGWAPANPWFAPGFEVKESIEVEGEKIYILPLPYFLATKFSAYIGRGANDPIMSHDFEDIIYILDNRMDLVEQMKKTPEDVKPFLKEQFELILSDRVKQEAIEGNLFYETRDIRYMRIMESLRELVGLL